MSDHISSQVLAKLKTTIQKSTRFEPEDVEGVKHEHVLQDFIIGVVYQLDARIASCVIDGTFCPQVHDEETYSPVETTGQSLGERIKEAHKQLTMTLSMPGRTYNSVQPGLYLPAQRRFWHLENCSSCYGHGKIACSACNGHGDNSCPSCLGTSRTRCDVCCMAGTISCTYCGGTGQTTHQVSYSNYNSNGDFVTEYRTEYISCTGGCNNGRKPCWKCHGNGTIICQTCYSSGRVQCTRCGGSGNSACSSCAATGKTGEVAQIDIHLDTEYSLTLPTSMPEDVRAIADEELVHGMAEQASVLVQVPNGIVAPSSNEIRVRYAGQIPICRDEVRCNNRDFSIVAYGKDLKWLSLDKILEHLLRADLDTLKQANNTARQEGIRSTNVEPLFQPLRQVIASELNWELVESALGKKDAAHVEHKSVSPAYAKEIHHELLETLRLLYTRIAKTFTLWFAMLAALIGLGTWWFAGTGWSIATVIAIAFLGTLLLDQSVRKLLSKACPSPGTANRAIGLAKQSGRTRQAKWLIWTPPLLIAMAMVVWMPASPADTPNIASTPNIEDSKATQTDATPQKANSKSDKSGSGE